MEELKSLFGDNSLTYDEFTKKIAEASETIKLANLKSGNYVDKAKYEKTEKDISDWKIKYQSLNEKYKDYDELKSNYEKLNDNYTKLEAKHNEAERLNLIKDKNVDNRFVKFVYSEVLNQTNDNKDFQQALDEFLKENKQYFRNSQSTYANLENNTTPPRNANQKMNDFIRRRR